MLISKNWLERFVDIPKTFSAEKLALELKMKTVEIDKLIIQSDNLKNIVVAKIVNIKNHPNADKLKLCVVDDGQGRPQVVCGGSNLKEGMKVAFGRPGAKVRWHGTGDLVELKIAKIRGEESHGMICQSTEIGLGTMYPINDSAEILDLSGINADVGMSLAEALGVNDVIFDIDHKSMSNRPDLWGHYGMAREVAAILGVRMKKQKLSDIKAGSDAGVRINIEDKSLCPRYMAVLIKGIKVGASPDWMRQKLISVGVRPINNIVDITNYVMHEFGQPMHAFDADKLAACSGLPLLSVRRAKMNEVFTALDGKRYELTNDTLVVADEREAVALAGVIGGQNSEIGDDTVNIIFEAANFDAASVRKTSMKLGVRTDSSTRFEKGLDPTNCELAMRRAVGLALQICPGAKVCGKVSDIYDYKWDRGPIDISFEFINKKIGITIPESDVARILENLGFELNKKKESLQVTVPTWRATKDIKVSEDIVEEVIRIYGYEKVPACFPLFPAEPPLENVLQKLIFMIKERFAYAFGYTEVYNYSFESPEWLKKIGFSVDKHFELDNPIAKDRPLVRRRLIPNMLANVEYNLHRFEKVKLFEVGKVFIREEGDELAHPDRKGRLPKQDTLFGAVYSEKGVDIPFYEISDCIIGIFDDFGVDLQIKKTDPSLDIFHPGRYAGLYACKTDLGIISELHPAVQERIGIPYRTAMLELNLNKLLPLISDRSNYKVIPQYPEVTRDIAFIVDFGASHQDIIKELNKIDSLIVRAELFDVYHGKGIGEGKKSMAYHIIYGSDRRTLEAAEVDKIHDKVIDMLSKNFGAEIRM